MEKKPTLKQKLLMLRITEMYHEYLIWKKDNDEDHLFNVYLKVNAIIENIDDFEDELMTIQNNFWAVWVGCTKAIEPYIDEFKERERRELAELKAELGEEGFRKLLGKD